jgi:hypothetical protein
MKDFLVYHNPDSMQCPVTAVDAKSIVTDKKVHDVEGSRVWLITGEGSPRQFLLRSCFVVDQVDEATRSKFKTKLSGHIGQVFEPMIPLNPEIWFKAFKRSQGNFAFGLQPINRREFVAGLERAAGINR